MSKLDKSTPSTIRRMTSQVLNSAYSKFPDQSPTSLHSCRMKPDSPSIFSPPPRAASTPPERSKAKQRSRATSKVECSTATDLDLNGLNMILSKKKSQYYDGAFASREPLHTAKNRSARESLIIVEVKLNFCLRSEHDFLIDLTFLCSEIYQRPMGCVTILLNSDFTILLGSSAEPAYHVSITAWITEVAVMKNKRTAGLIQDFMLETARIPANRGVFQFHSISEDNLLMNRCDGQEQMPNGMNSQTTSDVAIEAVDQYESYKSRKSSVVQPAICSNGIGATNRKVTPIPISSSNAGDIEGIPGVYSTEKRKVKKRKSLMALLGF